MLSFVLQVNRAHLISRSYVNPAATDFRAAKFSTNLTVKNGHVVISDWSFLKIQKSSEFNILFSHVILRALFYPECVHSIRIFDFLLLSYFCYFLLLIMCVNAIVYQTFAPFSKIFSSFSSSLLFNKKKSILPIL